VCPIWSRMESSTGGSGWLDVFSRSARSIRTKEGEKTHPTSWRKPSWPVTLVAIPNIQILYGLEAENRQRSKRWRQRDPERRVMTGRTTNCGPGIVVLLPLSSLSLFSRSLTMAARRNRLQDASRALSGDNDDTLSHLLAVSMSLLFLTVDS
jgi:hypothetical protein